MIHLKRKGFSVIEMSGYHDGLYPEYLSEGRFPLLLAVDIGEAGKRTLKENLIKLGSKFVQDAVLIVPAGGENAYLCGTSRRPGAPIKYGATPELGQGGTEVAETLLSELTEGKFALETVEFPDTIFGKMGWHLLEKKLDQELEA